VLPNRRMNPAAGGGLCGAFYSLSNANHQPLMQTDPHSL